MSEPGIRIIYRGKYLPWGFMLLQILRKLCFFLVYVSCIAYCGCPMSIEIEVTGSPSVQPFRFPPLSGLAGSDAGFAALRLPETCLEVAMGKGREKGARPTSLLGEPIPTQLAPFVGPETPSSRSEERWEVVIHTFGQRHLKNARPPAAVLHAPGGAPAVAVAQGRWSQPNPDSDEFRVSLSRAECML